MENRREGANIRRSLHGAIASRRALDDPGTGDGFAPGRFRGRVIEAIQKRVRRLIFLSLIACFAAAVPGPASGAGAAGNGEECAIQDVRLRKSPRNLAVSFRVAGAFDRELKETIQSGLPRTISFRLELYRPRLLLPDRKLDVWRLAQTIRYDNLKEEFLITRTVTADDGGAPRQLPALVKRRLPEAEATAAQVEGFPIPLSESATPVHYLLRIRARVEPLEEGWAPWFGRLPVPLIPAFGQMKSDWYLQEFEF